VRIALLREVKQRKKHHLDRMMAARMMASRMRNLGVNLGAIFP
jgi:hypothetical protein